MVVDAKELHNARAMPVLWPSKRRKVICRRPEDELGAKVSVAAESEVIKVLLEIGDFVRDSTEVMLEESSSSQSLA